MRWIVVALLVTGITVPAALFLLQSDDGHGPEMAGGAPADDGADTPWQPSYAGDGEAGSRGAGDGRAVAGGGNHRPGGNNGSAAGEVRGAPGPRAGGTGGYPDSRSDATSGAGGQTPGSARGGGATGGRGTRPGSGRGGSTTSGSGETGAGGEAGTPKAGATADVAGGVSVALRVWAEGEQLDLEELTILRVPRPTRNAIHPGPSITEHVVFPDLKASPITLPARRGSFIYWAHAPGFAWGSIEVDHTDGGERLLTLTREPVTLQITLDNYYPDSEAVIRIHHERARGPGVELAGAESLEVTGLPAGEYFVRVEIGDELWNSVLLGKSQVTTEKGQLYPVTVVLDDPPDLDGHVILGGTLALPPEWDSAAFSVRVQPLDVPMIQGKAAITVPADEMELVNGVLRWGVGLVVPGRYRVLIDPLKLCRTVTVVEDVASDVTLQVAPPTDVRVIVVDAETGTEVNLSRITWMSRGTPRGCQPMWEHRSAGNPFEFVAPLGEIEISNLFVDDWRVDPVRFPLQAGSNDLVVEASPACGVRISLVDGDTPLPLSDLPQSIQLQAQGSTNRIVSWSSNGNWKVARLSGPGQFVAKFGDVRGFRPIPDQTVTVPEGEFIDLEIQLERD